MEKAASTLKFGERARAFGGWAKRCENKLRKWSSRHNGGHNLQRTVDANGKMLVWPHQCGAGKAVVEWLPALC